MTDQQQQQQQRSSSSTSGTGGRPPPTKSSDTTGNNKGGGNGPSKAEKKKAARNRRKARDKQQNSGSNQQPRIKFKGGITDPAHLMYGHVITQGENMADQDRILKKQMKLHCSNKGHYRLSSSITSSTTLRQQDFLTPKPDPLLYSSTATATDGTITYTVNDSSMEESLKFIWGKNITNDIATWNKFEEFSKGLFETTMGQLDDKVIASCIQDTVRWGPIEADHDLIALLQLVEMICNQNKAGSKVYSPYENLIALERCLSSKQAGDITTTEYAAQVNVTYNSVIHQCGRSAFGENFLIDILQRNGITLATYNGYSPTDPSKVQFDAESRDLIIAMLILKGTNNDYGRECIKEQYLLGTRDDDVYPNTETKVITILDSLKRKGNNNNNNNNRNEAVVAAHVDYKYCSDDDSDDESVLSDGSMEEAAEAKILANVAVDVPPCLQPSMKDSEVSDDFKATVLANAVAKYDEDLQDIEDGFIDRIDNQQDVDDAFDDDEPSALACVHLAVIDGDDTKDDDDNDDFIVVPGADDVPNVNNDNTIQLLDSSDDDDVPIDASNNNNRDTNINIDNTIALLDAPSSDDKSDEESDESTPPTKPSVPIPAPQPGDRKLSPLEMELEVTRNTITAIYAVAVEKFKDRVHTVNNIIEYADALLFKLSTVRIHSATELHSIVENGSDAINDRLASAGHSKLHQDTVNLIRKESWKSSCYTERKSHLAYNATITMIGADDEVNFPDHSGIRVFIERTAELQRRRAPIRWTNNVTHKLIACGVGSKHRLREAIQNGTLNDIIASKGKPKFNKITISGIKTVLDQDFR